MQYLTLKQVRDKVLREHDLQEETFITPDEIDSYIRDAIDLAETIILGLYEDYFLVKTEWLPITASNELPTDIYANKLRKVTVRTNSQDEFGIQLHKNNHLSPCKTGYNIFHNTNQKPQLVFENLDAEFTEYQLVYTRNANRPTLNADLIDMPEVANNFVIQYAKVRCYQKERDPLAMDAKQELALIRESMIDTLSNMVDDGTEILKADMSFYGDFDQY
jgi:hypothetical protein